MIFLKICKQNSLDFFSLGKNIILTPYFLKEGKYSVSIYFKNALDGTWYSHYEDLIVFHVIANEINVENKGFYNNRAGVVVFQGSWKCKLIS